jgi:glycyl-tRNA synthetase beta chain
MANLFVELFSEEIPARMQARGAADLARLVTDALAPLSPDAARTYAGPRRIALAATVSGGVPDSRASERGPRVSAPEQALAGFLRKHAASRDELRQEGDFWVLERAVPGVDAATLIAREMPGLLRRFPWPKSMRWGGTSRFTWVRPLRRILCLLDGEVVAFDLRDGDDDGHGLASSNVTEGHRFLAPGAFPVASEAQWRDGLRARRVIVDAAERRRSVWDGVVAKAAERGLSVVPDEALLDEVAGLVEWPVALLGRIEDAYMDLPPEVMQVSMRVNQRYFALRDADGMAAPWFAFAANIEADDGGAAIIAGNERVLRARFSDARHFWDLDRTRTLESRVEDLRNVTFHARIGTQHDRALRLQRIAGDIADLLGAPVEQSRRAGLLCKADLTTGMVGEFPELQGVMGGYYARADEDMVVADAIRDHYAPRGPDDAVPTAPVTVAVAVADKLDQLARFFAIGEKPTGSGDPFALRRAALGVIRLLDENHFAARVGDLIRAAGAVDADEVRDFLRERLRVLWRGQGRRHDVLAAAFATGEYRISDLRARVQALTAMVEDADGANLLAGYRRAANILRIENAKDGPHDGEVRSDLLCDAAERALRDALETDGGGAVRLGAHDYPAALRALSRLRPPLDAFFEAVTVNSPQPDLRRNRLNLLHAVVSLMNQVADFSKIEG